MTVAIGQADWSLETIIGRVPQSLRLPMKVFLVGVVCVLTNRIGWANKVPPSNIAALWPTIGVVFVVLLVSPARDWWAYLLAAYVSSIIDDGRAGFPAAAFWYIAAGVVEVLIAAVGVRRFAGGIDSFNGLRNLVTYLAIAVVLAPAIGASIAAFAGPADAYWIYWRTWFFPESLAYLTVAPAILTAIRALRDDPRDTTLARLTEAFLVAIGLVVVSISVFISSPPSDSSVAAMVYLPLPFLMWAAVRFGPRGASATILIVALLSISGAVRGRGPFAASGLEDNLLALQLFLFVSSLPILFLATAVRERQELIGTLRESEARFRTMADGAPVLIWMAGTNKLRTYFNKNWLEFRGRSLEQEMGNGWTGGVHPDDFENCWATYTNAFDNRQDFEMEYRLRQREGEHRWIYDKGVPRYGQGGAFLGYIGSAIDVTERRQAEEDAALQRQQVAHLMRVSLLGELSGSIAHEINQPLGAILSNAEAALKLLEQKSPDLAKVREALRDIVQEDSRAGDVIQRLRNLMQKGEKRSEPVDIEDLVNTTVTMLHSEFIGRRVKLKVDTASSLPVVLGDPVQLQQVLLNLIMNALDAMGSNPLDQRFLMISARLSNAGTVELAVKDRGPGIRIEQDRLFEPFYTTKDHGLGLGLTICSTILRAHGGHLSLSNDQAGGAVAVVLLPVRPLQVAAPPH